MWKSILLFLNLFLNVGLSAQNKVDGYVIDMEESLPLVGVNVILFQEQNSSNLLFGSATDVKGYFYFEQVPKGKYRMECSMLGYKKQVIDLTVDEESICLDTVPLEAASERLEEIVVQAQMVKKKGNKESFWFSLADRNKVSSALGLLEGVPHLILNAMNNKIRTNRGGSVLILCDGLEISETDLLGLLPEDILRVEYFSNPPARYANKGVDAVVNVLTKRAEGGYLMANLKNSFVTGFGTNILQGKYSQGNSDFSLRYFLDYRDYKKNRLNQSWEYELDDGLYQVERKGLDGDYEGQYHTVQGMFAHIKPQSLFSAKMRVSVSPNLENSPQLVSGMRANCPIQDITSEINAEDRFVSPSLDLYYSTKISDYHEIIMNTVNTYYSSTADRSLTESRLGIRSYEQITHLDNKTYSNISELGYNRKTSIGEWNVGVRYYYKKLWDQYKNGANDFVSTDYNTQNLYIYTDWNGSWKKLDYTLGIGAEWTWLNTAQRNDFFVMKPSLLLSYALSKRSTLEFSSSIRSNIPDISLLTNNPAYLDFTFTSVGNPALKPYYTFLNNLQYTYNGSFWLNLFQSGLAHSYIHQGYSEVFRNRGNYVEKNFLNAYDIHNFTCDIGVRVKPWNWLDIVGYYALRYQVANGLGHRFDDWNHRLRITASATWKEWAAQALVLFPSRTLEGELFRETGIYYSGSIAWKRKSLSVQLAYVSNGIPTKTWSVLGLPIYYAEDKEWGNFEHLLYLQLTYTFSFGKQPKRDKSQRLNNQDMDSGLYIDNKAKM